MKLNKKQEALLVSKIRKSPGAMFSFPVGILLFGMLIGGEGQVVFSILAGLFLLFLLLVPQVDIGQIKSGQYVLYEFQVAKKRRKTTRSGKKNHHTYYIEDVTGKEIAVDKKLFKKALEGCYLHLVLLNNGGVYEYERQVR